MADVRDFCQAHTALVHNAIKHRHQHNSSIRSCSRPVISPSHPCNNLSPSPRSPTTKTCCTHCKPHCSFLDPLPPPKIQHIDQFNPRMPSGDCPNQNLLSIQPHTKSQPYPAFELEPNLPAPCSMTISSLYLIHPRKVLHLSTSESPQHVPFPSSHCNSFFYAQQPMSLCLEIHHEELK